MATVKTDGYITSDKTGDWYKDNQAEGEGSLANQDSPAYVRVALTTGGQPGYKVTYDGKVTKTGNVAFTDPGQLLSLFPASTPSGAVDAKVAKTKLFIVGTAISPLSLRQVFIVWSVPIRLLNKDAISSASADIESISVSGRVMVINMTEPTSIVGDTGFIFTFEAGAVGCYLEVNDPEEACKEEDKANSKDAGAFSFDAVTVDPSLQGLTCAKLTSTTPNKKDPKPGETNGNGKSPLLWCLGGCNDVVNDKKTDFFKPDNFSNVVLVTNGTLPAVPARCVFPFGLVSVFYCCECASTQAKVWAVSQALFGASGPLEILPQNKLHSFDPENLNSGDFFYGIADADINCATVGAVTVTGVGGKPHSVTPGIKNGSSYPIYAGQMIRFKFKCTKVCDVECDFLIEDIDEAASWMEEDILKPKERTLPVYGVVKVAATTTEMTRFTTETKEFSTISTIETDNATILKTVPYEFPTIQSYVTTSITVQRFHTDTQEFVTNGAVVPATWTETQQLLDDVYVATSGLVHVIDFLTYNATNPFAAVTTVQSGSGSFLTAVTPASGSFLTSVGSGSGNFMTSLTANGADLSALAITLPDTQGGPYAFLQSPLSKGTIYGVNSAICGSSVVVSLNFATLIICDAGGAEGTMQVCTGSNTSVINCETFSNVPTGVSEDTVDTILIPGSVAVNAVSSPGGSLHVLTGLGTPGVAAAITTLTPASAAAITTITPESASAVTTVSGPTAELPGDSVGVLTDLDYGPVKVITDTQEIEHEYPVIATPGNMTLTYVVQDQDVVYPAVASIVTDTMHITGAEFDRVIDVVTSVVLDPTPLVVTGVAEDGVFDVMIEDTDGSNEFIKLTDPALAQTRIIGRDATIQQWTHMWYYAPDKCNNENWIAIPLSGNYELPNFSNIKLLQPIPVVGPENGWGAQSCPCYDSDCSDNTGSPGYDPNTIEGMPDGAPQPCAIRVKRLDRSWRHHCKKV